MGKLKEKLNEEPSAASLAALTLVTIFTGTVFYNHFEGWNILDSLYFSIITLTTIGYGDFAPIEPISKMFTIFYVIIGIGIIFGFINLISKKRRI